MTNIKFLTLRSELPTYFSAGVGKVFCPTIALDVYRRGGVVDHSEAVPMPGRELVAEIFEGNVRPVPCQTGKFAADSEQGASVGPADMVAIADEILGRDFPIAGENAFHRRTQQLQPAPGTLPDGIQIPAKFAQIFFQAWSVSIAAAENEAFVRLHPDVLGTELFLIELPMVAPCFKRNINEAAILAEHPAVVVADERLGIAAVGVTNLVAPVRTRIDECPK